MSSLSLRSPLDPTVNTARFGSGGTTNQFVVPPGTTTTPTGATGLEVLGGPVYPRLVELPPEVSSQEWHFEGDPAKLAVELLAAFLVGRNEHAEAGMTAAARNGHDFTIAYAWAMGVAVLANPDGELASARQSFRVPTIAVEGSAANSIVAGYAGMVAAAANRNAAAAQEMWRGMSIAEQQWVVSNLLHNLRHGFARALQM